MIKKMTLLAIHVFALFLLLSFNVNAQDRAALEKEIGALREQLKQKEDEFLSPSAGDRAALAEFLRQPDVGLARLMPREYREKPSLREGGAYYSFTRLSNSYNDQPQIELEQGMLNTGFSGADFGFFTSLGDAPLESVDLTSEGVGYLAGLVAPNNEAEAREQQRISSAGSLSAGHIYKRSLPAVVNHTYVLRSVGYDRFDILVAFRVERKDTDGSLILAWKKLRELPKPNLVREQAAH